MFYSSNGKQTIKAGKHHLSNSVEWRIFRCCWNWYHSNCCRCSFFLFLYLYLCVVYVFLFVCEFIFPFVCDTFVDFLDFFILRCFISHYKNSVAIQLSTLLFFFSNERNVIHYKSRSIYIYFPFFTIYTYIFSLKIVYVDAAFAVIPFRGRFLCHRQHFILFCLPRLNSMKTANKICNTFYHRQRFHAISCQCRHWNA